MPKFLVVDDAADRVPSYKELFNFLEIEYLVRTEELNKTMQRDFDGYIIDVKLDGANSGNAKYFGASFANVIDKVPSNKPIFIVSGKWKEVMDGSEMSVLLKSGRYKNVLGYFSWDKISKEQLNLYQDYAKTQLYNFQGVRNSYCEDDEDFTVLQISDLEFGNIEQYEYIQAETSQIISNIREDLNALKLDKQKVDAVVVCGDIAYAGKKEEYKNASNWIKNFCKQILKDESIDGLIMVPGNHDICVDSTLQNYCYFDFAEKKIKIRTTVVDEYSELALYNFMNFEYKLTGKQDKFLNPQKFYVNKNFLYANIIFLEIYPAYFDPQTKKFKYVLNDNDFDSMEKELKDIDDNTTVMVVSHVPNETINMVDGTAVAIRAELKNFIERNKIKVWMNGHSHSDTKVDDVKIGSKKRLIMTSDALLIKPAGRCDGSPGGYTLVNFKRKNKRIVAAEYLENGEIQTEYLPFDE